MMNFLNELEMFGIKLGLTNIRYILKQLGRPDRHLKIIHVAGTNGKGSVCAMVERALREAGFKVGFYSSPHLIKLNERFKINGECISDHQLKNKIQKLKPIAQQMMQAGNTPTFFEFTTAIALDWFAQKNCDFVVFEVGMGGRLDATNVVRPILSAITRIDLDHQVHLGTTLAAIATEKAGIIKRKVPVVIGAQSDEAMNVLRETAHQFEAPIINAATPGGGDSLALSNGHQEIHLYGHIYELSLAGVWQKENAAIAYKILEYLSERYPFDLKKSLESWKDVHWDGRFQLLNWNTVIDGAHNVAGAQALQRAWAYRFGHEKATILFANFADKDTQHILEILAPMANRFIFVPIVGAKNRPSMQPNDLVKLMTHINPEIPCECHETIHTAIPALKTFPGYHLITGSLFLVADYFTFEKLTS